MREITVVLATANGALRLPRVLAGLMAQSLAPARFEVIAVDDGSNDGTRAVLEAWSHLLRLRVVRQNRAGIAAARTLGLFLARSDIVLFLSDDLVAERDLLAEHQAAHTAHPDVKTAVASPVGAAAEEDRQLMRLSLGCTNEHGGTESSELREISDPMAFGRGPTSFKRMLLAEHGVFRPDFRLGYEDVELACRLRAKGGLRLLVVSRVGARAMVSLTFEDACARSYVEGHMCFWLTRLHNALELRESCGIDSLVALWSRRSSAYAAHLRWTRKLDQLVRIRHFIGMPPHPLLQQTLSDARRDAFALSRAKGVADAAVLVPTQALTTGLEPSVLDYGLSGARDDRVRPFAGLESIAARIGSGAR
jgi:glycosyltransferase involved in cell wall biosynthesis